MQISDYDITEDRGFLSSFDPAEIKLPDSLSEVRRAALALPQTLPSGRTREILSRVPELDVESFLDSSTDSEQRLAMVHYSFLVQSWVWGEPKTPASIPRNLARPIWHIANALGQQPLLPYSGYVLDNWGRIDASGPISLDNTYVLQPFLGGQDEAWFVLIHVAIEARAGSMLAAIPSILTAADGKNSERLCQGLDVIVDAWTDINAIFDRMPERCDPYIYFERVRPWIHGWKNNPALGEGLIYEGVAETGNEPQTFRGQTGSQSSIVPTMDSLLGISHANDPLREYLDELHEYRPPAHRRFIEDVRSKSSVRAYIESAGITALIERYDRCMHALAQFRSRHLQYAASYINRQQRDKTGNDTATGTGGTPFMRYLKKHRNETEKQMLGESETQKP